MKLRKTEAKHRKVSILLYGFPPNVGAVGTAALLNVGSSLGNLLKELRGQGYSVGGTGAGPGEGEASLTVTCLCFFVFECEVLLNALHYTLLHFTVLPCSAAHLPSPSLILKPPSFTILFSLLPSLPSSYPTIVPPPSPPPGDQILLSLKSILQDATLAGGRSLEDKMESAQLLVDRIMQRPYGTPGRTP